MQTDYDALCARLRAEVPYEGRSRVAFQCHEAAAAITTLREELREARESADRLAEALGKFLAGADAGIVSVAVDREARTALTQHRSKP